MADLERGFIIEIVSKLRHGPYTTTTHYLGTDHYEADEIYSGSARTIGIVRRISEIKREVGNPIPRGRSVSFSVDDTRGSFGLNKRFKDLLDKEEMIAQSCVIKSFKKPIGSAGVIGDVKTEFTGKITSISLDNQNSILRINAESDGLPKCIENTIINPAVSDFANAPTKNIGRPLPIVFGKAQVPGLNVVDNIDDADFALATTGGTDYPIASIDQVYAKDRFGDFVSIEGASSTTTPFDFSNSSTTPAASIGLNGAASFEPATSFEPDTGAIITRCDYELYVIVASNWDGTLLLGIWTDDMTGLPNERIGGGEAELTGSPGTGGETVTVYMKDPVVVEAGKKYWLSVRLAGNSLTSGSPNITTAANSGAPTVTNAYKSDFNDGPAWVEVSPSGHPTYDFLGCTLTDSLSDAQNWAGVYIDRAGGTSVPPDLGKISIIADITGLTDDSSGTVTGTASKTLDNAAEAAGYLLEQAGAGYDLTTLDCEEVLDITENRVVGGATSGRQTIDAIISRIFNQHACFGFRNNDGEFVVFPYGFVTGDTHYITEFDAKLLKWEIQNPRSIVTHTDIAYRKLAAPLDLEDLTIGQNRNYGKFLEQQNSDGGDPGSWTQDSFELYGDITLTNTSAELDWIYETDSAEWLSEYYLKVFNRPIEIVEISLPYFERDYRDIDLMCIVELEHVDNISETGTSADGYTKFPVDSGEPDTDITNNKPWRAAKKYPMRVIGRTVTDDHRLILKCKVLNNDQEIY